MCIFIFLIKKLKYKIDIEMDKEMDKEMDVQQAKKEFLCACVDNDIEKIKTIFKKYVDSNIIITGYTLLACNGHSETLKYLLDNTKWKYIDDKLKYWIFINGASNNHKNIVELIVQYNFNINYSPDYQLTPIEYCNKYCNKYCNSKNKQEILEILNNFMQASKKCCDTNETLLNEIERLKNKI